MSAATQELFSSESQFPPQWREHTKPRARLSNQNIKHQAKFVASYKNA